MSDSENEYTIDELLRMKCLLLQIRDARLELSEILGYKSNMNRLCEIASLIVSVGLHESEISWHK
jgi:hypothetical protein